jgi:ATP-dependent Lhr-like helicase
VWHLVWTGEATIDGFEAIRHARVSSGLSACYDLASRPGERGGSTDEIAHRMREYRRLDPTLGRWAPTERLRPDTFEAAEPEQRAIAWARLLLRRCGIVCRESLRREVCAPHWGDVRRALIKMEMLGQVRRGFFVEDLPGEQYGLPEAVEALRDAKASHDEDEPMILLDYCDPANVFHDLFPLTNQDGEPVKVLRMPQKYLVVQGGEPLLLYHGAITVLRDLSAERAEQAMRMLLRLLKAPVARHEEIALRDWNGHPCDVSRALPLLQKLAFVPSTSRWKGFVCNGRRRGDAGADVPDVLERIGKEDAPVAYDAEWIVSRSPEAIRPKVAELIAFLENWCPEACEVGFEPRRFVVRYRGIKCMHAHIQLKKIWLHITHRGWSPGVQIEPDTDLDDPQFVENINRRFDRVRQMIDAELERRGARARERT